MTGLLALLLCSTTGARAAAAAKPAPPPPLALVPVATVELRGWADDRFALEPDLDGDGIPEIYVTQARGSEDAPYFAVISPGKGGLLYCFQDFVPMAASRLGRAHAFGPDVDQDGVSDLVVSATGRRLVSLLSGADGRLLHSWSSKLPGFGSALALGRNGSPKAQPEVAIGAPGARTVDVYSTQSGGLVRQLKDSRAQFGRELAWSSAEAKPSLAVAAAGEVIVYSATDGAPLRRVPADGYPARWPSRISFLDIDGNGEPELVAEDELTAAVLDGTGKSPEVELFRGTPVAAGTSQARAYWLYADGQSERWFLGVAAPASDAKPSGGRDLIAIAVVPGDIDPSDRESMSIDQSGRWWLSSRRDDAAAAEVLHLFFVGQPSVKTRQRAVVTAAPESCPLLWDPAATDPNVVAAARPLLERLASSLELLAAEPPKGRAEAVAALKEIADRHAGMWFWQSAGVSSEPTLHFPDPRWPSGEKASPVRSSLREAAVLVKKLTATAALPSSAILSGRLALRELLRANDLAGPALPQKKLAGLPVELALSISESDPDAGPSTLTVFFTMRGGRLAIAHVIYHDASA